MSSSSSSSSSFFSSSIQEEDTRGPNKATRVLEEIEVEDKDIEELELEEEEEEEEQEQEQEQEEEERRKEKENVQIKKTTTTTPSSKTPSIKTPPSIKTRRITRTTEGIIQSYIQKYGVKPITVNQLLNYAKLNHWILKYSDAKHLITNSITSTSTTTTTTTTKTSTISNQNQNQKKILPIPPTKIITNTNANANANANVVLPSSSLLPPLLLKDNNNNNNNNNNNDNNNENQQVKILYKNQIFTIDLPTTHSFDPNKKFSSTTVYTLGQLRKDLCIKGIIDEPLQMVAFKINGNMVYQYNQDVKDIIRQNPNIQLEVINPNEQIASTGITCLNRIQKEDPNRIQKKQIQTEFIKQLQLKSK